MISLSTMTRARSCAPRSRRGRKIWPTKIGPSFGVWPVRDDLLAEEILRRVDEDAGAVAGFAVGVDGAAVPDGFQRGERERDDIAARFAVDGGDEADAAGVALVCRRDRGRRAQARVASRAIVARDLISYAVGSFCRDLGLRLNVGRASRRPRRGLRGWPRRRARRRGRCRRRRTRRVRWSRR